MKLETAENFKGYVRLGFTLIFAAIFTKISMNRTGEFRIVAPIVGFFISMMAVLGSEQLVRWSLFKKEGKIGDVRLAGEVAGTLVLALILQTLFSLILGFGLLVVSQMFGFT